jgi:hypothetical protein
MILLLTAESPRNPEAHDRTFVMARQVTVAVDDHFVQLSVRYGYLAAVQQVSEGFLRAARGRKTVVTGKRQRMTASWGLAYQCRSQPKDGSNSLSSIYLAASRTCQCMGTTSPYDDCHGSCESFQATSLCLVC